MRSLAAVILALALSAGAARAQVGNLIWEDNFNDLGNWITLTGNGSWQKYSSRDSR